MKSKIAVMMAVVCLTFFTGSMTVLAAGPEYCDACGTSLSTNVTQVAHWQITHDVELDIGGAAVTGKCTITYVIYHVTWICSGCGKSGEGNYQTDTHSYSH